MAAETDCDLFNCIIVLNSEFRTIILVTYEFRLRFEIICLV